MMDGWDGGMSTGGWILMTLVWVLLLLVIVWAVVQVLPARRDAGAPPEPQAETDTPQAILARRLARGEIDEQTYERLQAKLGPPAAAGGH